MAEWLTVEVFDAQDPVGAFPASVWQDAHGNDLVEAAITHGAVYWEWHTTRWGVVLELAFPDDERLERYRDLPAVQAALEAVPDRVSGLLVYRGRGGGSGAKVPRRPRPAPVAGAAAWPIPVVEESSSPTGTPGCRWLRTRTARRPNRSAGRHAVIRPWAHQRRRSPGRTRSRPPR